jgi:zinc/manganese transport system permease protein
VIVASLAPIYEPGFLGNGPVQTALVVGGVAAVVSAMAGTFAVIRGQSFAGHSLADIGSAGGSAAFLAGFSPLFGFVVFNILAAGTMELIGIRRPRSRDVATGIVLGAALGLAALFLFLDTRASTSTGATINVLFGSIFTTPSSLITPVVIVGSVGAGMILLSLRPLALTSLNPDLAATRAVNVRLVGIGYMFALALAVSLSAITIGAILSTALLIGPAAAALRLTNRIGLAMLFATIIGVAATWIGLLLAYDSYVWFPEHGGWPVSFFIVAITVVIYLVAQILPTGRRTPAVKARS